MSDPLVKTTGTLLAALRDGQDWPVEDLVPRVYEQLRIIARAQLVDVHGPHSLGPTELVHEAWLRMEQRGAVAWDLRSHLFHAAARAMRDVLVERHRRRDALRRGGSWGREGSDPDDLPVTAEAQALETWADILDRVELPTLRQRDVLRLRLHEGLDEQSAAERLGVSVRTIQREWSAVKARLRVALAEVDRDARGGSPSV